VVLLALADYTNSNGIAWPAVPILAKKARMSKRNVQRCLRALEKAGELEIRPNKGRRGSNIYRITLTSTESNNTDAHVTHDVGVAKTMSPVSLAHGSSVAQSVIKPLVEITPIVPTGDEIEFWIRTCFECFKQPRRLLQVRIKRKLLQSIGDLDTQHAGSLVKFYRSEPLDSRKPLYSSRRHSLEHLILDLPRQLALAVQEYPPPVPPKPSPEYSFTIEDVWEYLREEYHDCPLPRSLAELDTSQWDGVRSEILEAMRTKNEKKAP